MRALPTGQTIACLYCTLRLPGARGRGREHPGSEMGKGFGGADFQGLDMSTDMENALKK